MSDAAKINHELASLSKKLAEASNEFTDLCKKAAESRSAYDVSKAKALLKSSLKTAIEKQSEATIVCEKEMLEARVDEAMRDATKERLRALESVLNATQTRAAFLRDEMKLAGKDY